MLLVNLQWTLRPPQNEWLIVLQDTLPRTRDRVFVCQVSLSVTEGCQQGHELSYPGAGTTHWYNKSPSPDQICLPVKSQADKHKRGLLSRGFGQSHRKCLLQNTRRMETWVST